MKLEVGKMYGLKRGNTAVVTRFDQDTGRYYARHSDDGQEYWHHEDGRFGGAGLYSGLHLVPIAEVLGEMHTFPSAEVAKVLSTETGTPDQERRRAEKLAKLRWDLLPQTALLEVVKVFNVGAKKHGPNEWREQELPYSMFINASSRHRHEFENGMSIDPEFGLHHLAHEIVNRLILLEYELKRLGKDDRFVYSDKKEAA